MRGAKANILKQDPTVRNAGIETVFIPETHAGPVNYGPSDNEIAVYSSFQRGVTGPDQYGNLTKNPYRDPFAFDSANVYSIARKVLTMYQRALLRLGSDYLVESPWQWSGQGGQQTLRIDPHAGVDRNAYYSRNERELRFFYFKDGNGQRVFTCRSLDIVAHEVGHAILDSLKPRYFEVNNPETGGLHESFGDLTAIFFLLSKLEMCEKVIVATSGDFKQSNFLSKLAEQFGDALGRDKGLRNANNHLTIADTGYQVHSISRVFTGAIYQILAALFENYVDVERYDPAETLYRIGKHLSSIFLLAVLRSSDEATFSEIAFHMRTLSLKHRGEEGEKWAETITQEFISRDIDPLVSYSISEEGVPDWHAATACVRAVNAAQLDVSADQARTVLVSTLLNNGSSIFSSSGSVTNDVSQDKADKVDFAQQM